MDKQLYTYSNGQCYNDGLSSIEWSFTAGGNDTPGSKFSDLSCNVSNSSSADVSFLRDIYVNAAACTSALEQELPTEHEDEAYAKMISPLPSEKKEPTKNMSEDTLEKKKRHICHVCGKDYARLESLKHHHRTHTGVRPYKCSHCQKAFIRSDHCIIHERTHTGEKPFKCAFCCESFSSSSKRLRHTAKMHQVVDGQC